MNAHPHFRESIHEAYWQMYRNPDAVLIDCLYELAEAQLFDTIAPDHGINDPTWTIGIFANDADFNALLAQACHDRVARLSERMVVPERIGATP